MQKLMKWVGSQGDWTCSAWNLPALAADADVAVQRWAVVAGGLALVLSRTEAAERSARFGSSHALYVLVRRALRQARLPAPGAALIGEAMHELVEVADPATRRCLMACFQDAAKHPLRAQAAANQSWEPASTQAMPSTAARVRDTRQSLSSSVSSDLLLARASSLRKSLAAARTGIAAASRMSCL
jgi:hypothetical protein